MMSERSPGPRPVRTITCRANQCVDIPHIAAPTPRRWSHCRAQTHGEQQHPENAPMERSTPSTAVLEQQRHTNSTATRTAVSRERQFHENGSFTRTAVSRERQRDRRIRSYRRTARGTGPTGAGQRTPDLHLHDAAGKITEHPGRGSQAALLGVVLRPDHRIEREVAVGLDPIPTAVPCEVIRHPHLCRGTDRGPGVNPQYKGGCPTLIRPRQPTRGESYW